MQIAGNPPALAVRLATAIREYGARAECVNIFSTGAGTAIITADLSAGDPGDAHWYMLEQAKAAKAADCKRLLFLQETGAAQQSGMAGLAKTAAREWPAMDVHFIELAPGLATAAEAILLAIASGHIETRIDVNGNLNAPQLGATIMPPTTAIERSGGVWLVTGGARGVTAACTIELVRQTGGTFVLLGRSKLSAWPEGVAQTDSVLELRGLLAQKAVRDGHKAAPSDINRASRNALAGAEIRATLAAITMAGGNARYYPCDLTDASMVAQTVHTAQADLGTITGLVHGAGVLADRLIMDKTRNEFDRVFGTKVTGVSTVLQALDAAALKHIAFFSSAAARFGNAGQADYAIANEVLNRFAHQFANTLPAARVKSFNWGPWDGGMVDDALARHFEAQGVGLIPIAIGARIFADQILHGNPQQVEILVGDEWTR